MRVTILGLWHLGCVTAACCAERFAVQGLDMDVGLIARLNEGQPPISEPGLAELIQTGLRKGALSFSTDVEKVCANTDLLWVCFDTPVDDQDRADVEFVLSRLRACLAHLPPGSLVLISSQMPVGTCKELSAEFPQFSFACSPENLQLGRALDAFRKPERIIVGVRDERGPVAQVSKPAVSRVSKPADAPKGGDPADLEVGDTAGLETCATTLPTARAKLQWLLGHFSNNLLFVSPEAAEMIKHALNSFLAMSVSFINEIARLCELLGADARQVEAGLKSDARIGPRAYLSPGPAFAGGTLARDVEMLSELGRRFGEELLLIPAIKQSNDRHKQWPLHKLQRLLGELKGKTIAVLGLTYKPLTDTLRRSSSVELCEKLVEQRCAVRAFDPAIKQLALAGVTLCASVAEALRGADAVVLATPWPEFRKLDWAAGLGQMRRPLVLDAHGFLKEQMRGLENVEYHAFAAPGDGRTPT